MSTSADDSTTGSDTSVPEPTPWGLGLPVGTAFALYSAFVLVGVHSLVGSVAAPLGLGAAVLVAGGIGWPLWDLRARPVWRWVTWGTLIGLLAGVGAAVALVVIGR